MRSLPVVPDQEDPSLQVHAECIAKRFFEEAARLEPEFRHSEGGTVWSATVATCAALLAQGDIEPGACLPLHIEPLIPWAAA